MIEAMQIGCVIAGGDEQMAPGVGKAVEDDQAARRAPEDEIFAVVLGMVPVLAEEASGGFLVRM